MVGIYLYILVMNEITEILEPWNRFSETFDNLIPQTEKQIKAKNTMLWVLRVIREKWLPLEKPLMVMLHSKPWRWKSHLMRSLMNELWKLNIEYKFCSNPWGSLWKNHIAWKVCFIDDLYADKQSIEHLNQYDYWRLEEVLFDVYDNNKILVLSSNFSLNDILEFIKKYDSIGRIASRLTEFISYCPDLEIDWEDQRPLRKNNNPFDGYF